MEKRQLIALSLNVFIWYYASVLSATSAQIYVKSLHSTGWVENAFAMLLVTFVQMSAGALLGLLVGMVILSLRNESLLKIFARTQHRNNETSATTNYCCNNASGCNTSLLLPLLFTGLHAAGSLFTNLGYSCSSASFVQIIKLTEPIQTSILDFAFRKLWGVPRQQIKTSISCVVLGTVFVIFSRNNNISKGHTTFWAIVTVVLSGTFLSSRNVIKKIIHHESSPKIATSATHPPFVSDTLIEGVKDFIQISLGGVLFLFPIILLVFVLLCVTSGSHELIFRTVSPSIYPFGLMVLTHSIYNLASLVVLSFVAAPLHSLLNSGKRLSSTLFVMLWFGEPMTAMMVLGLAFILVGMFPSSNSRRGLVVMVILYLASSELYDNLNRIQEGDLIVPKTNLKGSSRVNFAYKNSTAAVKENASFDAGHVPNTSSSFPYKLFDTIAGTKTAKSASATATTVTQ